MTRPHIGHVVLLIVAATGLRVVARVLGRLAP
jgi:hypothetical protein